jgi:DNA ligase 1
MPFKPMLSGTVPILGVMDTSIEYDFSKVVFPVIASPKYDGIRVTNQEGKLLSRSMKPIASLWINSAFSGDQYHGFDGELIYGPPVGNDVCNRTMRAIKRLGPAGVDLYAFDIHLDVNHDMGFKNRLMVLRLRMEDCPHVNLKLVPQTPIENESALMAYYHARMAEGYEGVMIRRPDGRYKEGRSTLNEGILLRLKPFSDAEAIIIGFEEGDHNANEAIVNERGNMARSSAKAGKIPNGTLGALIVRDCLTGKEFNIGTGFTSKVASEIWNNRPAWLGKMVTYKSQLVGAIDKPRQPVFKGLRSKEDIS